MMPIIETTLDEILSSYDWAEVFADESSGNTDKETSPIPELSGIDTTPPSRADVAEVMASVEGEQDERDWLGVFRLHDGRFLVASGGCDYTGWD